MRFALANGKYDARDFSSVRCARRRHVDVRTTFRIILQTIVSDLERTANRIYGVDEDRSPWRRYGLAFVLAVTVEVMLMIGLIVFGAISFGRMGISQLPDIDYPIVNVRITEAHDYDLVGSIV